MTHLTTAEAKDGWTPLLRAAFADDAEKVKALLAAGADADQAFPDDGRSWSGYSPLLLAVRVASTSAVRALMGRAKIDLRHARSGKTALYTSVQLARLECLRVLVAGGAAVDVPTAHGRTPLFQAASLGNAKLVRILVDAGANVNLTSTGAAAGFQPGLTALHTAGKLCHCPCRRLAPPAATIDLTPPPSLPPTQRS